MLKKKVLNPSVNSPKKRYFRNFRGGGWGNRSMNCRSAFRDYYNKSLCTDYLGFIIALVKIKR